YLNPEAYQMEPPLAFGQYIKGAIGLMMVDDRAAALKYFGAEEGARIWGLTQAYLVDERNRGFLETIAPELQRGGVLMVMGAFHLPGDTGMVAILRDAGFTVTRVPTDGELP
ncbi:MAG: TraB/GumN family protein, partial [Pseudomonadota bacterium]